MVNEKKVNGKKYFQCEQCHFYYIDKKIAMKCQKYCKEHTGPSIKIIKNGLKIV
jgi:hypothetical protein